MHLCNQRLCRYGRSACGGAQQSQSRSTATIKAPARLGRPCTEGTWALPTAFTPVTWRPKSNAVLARGHLGHGEAATQTAAAVSSSNHTPPADSVAHPFPGLDMQPMVVGSYTADAHQSLDEQQREYMDQQLDDFEEVAQQLPLIKAELGDQQALLLACNQFLEDMAERHLDLLLQQQTAQRLAASRPNTPTAAGVDAMTLQAYAQLQQQVQEVSAQLVQQRQQAEEILQQKDTLKKQLRIVTMEREELKEQMLQQQETASHAGPTPPTDDAAAAAAASQTQLQDTLQQLTQVQEKLVAAEGRLGEALDSNKQLTEQLQAANSIAEAARASALAATSAASAQSHVQLQEASARVAALEAQLAAAEQHGSAVAASNTVLQQQLRDAHAQGGRLISMNKQLMQHAAKLEQRHQQQAELVNSLKDEKAAQAAELARIFITLREMQGAQQRQQQLQQRLMQVISTQQQQWEAEESVTSAQAAATASGADAGDASSAQAVAAGQEASGASDGGGLVRALGALPLVGHFLR